MPLGIDLNSFILENKLNYDAKSLFDLIINTFSGPNAIDDMATQFLVTSIDYDSYVGQIAIGRLNNGSIHRNKLYSLCGKDEIKSNQKLTACYTFKGLNKIKVDTLEAGDIIAIAGIENIKIGDTISDNEDPKPLERIIIDEPTVSMFFHVNNGPFAGKEGKYITSRHLKGRLEKEILGNVSLKVNTTKDTDVFEVCGRGELQMAILIETMRREGYEFMVSKPQVITKEKDGQLLEPVENIYLDLDENHVGTITEKLSLRKGKMVNLQNNGFGRVTLQFKIPSRGLIGFRGEFVRITRGEGIMSHSFYEYKPKTGDFETRRNGVLIAFEEGVATFYALKNAEDRGVYFIKPGVKVYKGMIIGENNRPQDLELNICKTKQLTNMRSAGAEELDTLQSPVDITLERALEYIGPDEMLEVTPDSIRMRKINKKKRN